MEQTNTSKLLLDLLNRPAFCVRDGVVIQANRAATQRLIQVGTEVASLLPNDYSAYRDFTGGCLYLTLVSAGISCGASVTRTDDLDLFQLDQEADSAELKTLALAAQQLRVPLQSLMAITEQLPKSDTKSLKRAGQINQAIHQLHRIICNMSDVNRYFNGVAVRMEMVDISGIFDEATEKLSTLAEASGRKLLFHGLPQATLGLADSEMLNRAISNLVSNAIKFSPNGSILDVKLTRTGNMLSFSIQDQGQGITPEVLGNIFHRYTREPTVEDSRNGIGLGMALVRSVATAHGGTVLIDQPDAQGVRITMTIAIRKNSQTTVRSPIRLPIGDYAGGRDPGLLELSEVLPDKLYREQSK